MIRLKIDDSKDYTDIEILIKCPEIDRRLTSLIEHIKQNYITLVGVNEERSHSLIAYNLYYVESIDNKTFFYDEKVVYESTLKLYELEELLQETPFIRISKNLIVNTAYVEHVRALFNGKFEATLSNGEKVIVNRHYAKAFKNKFLN
ncbi:LytTR family DNA-binding domain-containing protein [Sporosarcina limicola]|uniref:DNA-binding LytR/AlgR family response regulator n=1 Tax=Sporosarcina limicola TaxID=34101 RepID=A0A927RCT6_9BACL|nr:LytTR family DNA-binding domain-containing protein [Sporosarcina limicola]MBE1554715.1 DNA-binding LytR/AlgR family response regulator [Sporosarcina limicola]